MYYVYFLQSEDKNHFYIGASKDVDKRLAKHNYGSSKSTRPYRPWKIIHKEACPDKQTAMKREYYLKSTSGYLEKKSIINKNST